MLNRNISEFSSFYLKREAVSHVRNLLAEMSDEEALLRSPQMAFTRRLYGGLKISFLVRRRAETDRNA